jgi:tetratricopeptide (TPR) repeat protein
LGEFRFQCGNARREQLNLPCLPLDQCEHFRWQRRQDFRRYEGWCIHAAPEHSQNRNLGLPRVVNGYEQGKYKEAEECHRKALVIRRKVLGEEHPDTALSYSGVALNLHAQGKHKEAEEGLRKALAIYRKVLGEERPDTALSYYYLAYNLNDQGKYKEAEESSRKALAIYRKVLGEEHPDTATALAQLGDHLLKQKKFIEAEPLLRECLTIREQKLPDKWTTFNTRSALGEALLGQEKYGEAEPLLVNGYEQIKKHQDKVPPAYRQVRLSEALERLVRLYEATEQKEKADYWRRELQEAKAVQNKARPKETKKE